VRAQVFLLCWDCTVDVRVEVAARDVNGEG
jgi:hypothetical protein